MRTALVLVVLLSGCQVRTEYSSKPMKDLLMPDNYRAVDVTHVVGGSVWAVEFTTSDGAKCVAGRDGGVTCNWKD